MSVRKNRKCRAPESCRGSWYDTKPRIPGTRPTHVPHVLDVHFTFSPTDDDVGKRFVSHSERHPTCVSGRCTHYDRDPEVSSLQTWVD